MNTKILRLKTQSCGGAHSAFSSIILVALFTSSINSEFFKT